jgi:holo-[acyl-carrier protein] synthase
LLRLIAGIGIDIVELSRIEELSKRQSKFVDRILTNKEKEKYHTYNGKRQTEYLAGRFAAKEAYSKAVGTGIGEALSFLDIEIQSGVNGQPMIIKPVSEGVYLSISHSRDYAVAQVVIEKNK